MPASSACLDVTATDLAQLAERSIALRERLKAAGVAAIGRSSASSGLVDWFVAVLREVSHDLPAHAAVWGTAHERFGVDPLVFGDPAALDRCRILAIAEKQDRIAEALVATPEGNRFAPQGAPHLGIDIETVPTFGGPGAGAGAAGASTTPSPARAPAARRDLAQELRNREFVAESVDGVDTVRELTRQAGEIDESRAHRAGSRPTPGAPMRRS